jgi:hypothetical protein
MIGQGEPTCVLPGSNRGICEAIELKSTPFDISQQEENVADEKLNFYERVQSTSGL